MAETSQNSRVKVKQNSVGRSLGAQNTLKITGSGWESFDMA